MKAIITGINGTVGNSLKNFLKEQQWQVIGWQRTEVPIDSSDKIRDFLQQQHPDVLFHLAVASQPTGKENEYWLVNNKWPEDLAKITHEMGIRLVFTSTVMVFSDSAKGPFTVNSVPDSMEGYGREKKVTEDLILQHNPQAVIARLGWQIGNHRGSNNMLDHLFRQHEREGRVSASSHWLPACSFLDDTAAALLSLVENDPGVYMVNSNDKWNYYQIVCALNKLHGNPWRVEETQDFVYDQRMIDPRVTIANLEKRLDFGS